MKGNEIDIKGSFNAYKDSGKTIHFRLLNTFC